MRATYVPPPGAGIGPGATPPMSPIGPVPVVPVPDAMIEHTMITLLGQYALETNDAAHLQWLMSTGLIRAQDAHGIIESLGVQRRERTLSPDDPRCQMSRVQDAQTSPMLPDMPAITFPELPPLPAPQVPARQMRLELMPTLVPRARAPPASWTEHFDIASQPDEPRPCQSPRAVQSPGPELNASGAQTPLGAPELSQFWPHALRRTTWQRSPRKSCRVRREDHVVCP